MQSRLDAVTPARWTPLVGRDEEVTLMRQRWGQAQAGLGQVVLLSGEAGIGKSRLVQVLKDHVSAEPHTRIEWRASPYHQQSALSPVIDQLQGLLRGPHDAAPAEQVRPLEAMLTASGVALAEAVPLLAALLSLPLPAAYSPSPCRPNGSASTRWRPSWRGCIGKRNGRRSCSWWRTCTGLAAGWGVRHCTLSQYRGHQPPDHGAGPAQDPTGHP